MIKIFKSNRNGVFFKLKVFVRIVTLYTKHGFKSEAVLEELGNQCLIFGQSGNTIAKITGGQESQLAAQAT